MVGEHEHKPSFTALADTLRRNGIPVLTELWLSSNEAIAGSEATQPEPGSQWVISPLETTREGEVLRIGPAQLQLMQLFPEANFVYYPKLDAEIAFGKHVDALLLRAHGKQHYTIENRSVLDQQWHTATAQRMANHVVRLLLHNHTVAVTRVNTKLATQIAELDGVKDAPETAARIDQMNGEAFDTRVGLAKALYSELLHWWPLLSREVRQQACESEHLDLDVDTEFNLVGATLGPPKRVVIAKSSASGNSS
jgi:hypothetical protein